MELIAGLIVAVMGLAGATLMYRSKAEKAKAKIEQHKANTIEAHRVKDEIISNSADADTRQRLRNAYTRREGDE